MVTGPDRQDRHDTVVLPGSPAWRDTEVLVAPRPQIAAGWFPDPYGGRGLRYWDGIAWTGWTHGAGRSARRRSVGLALVLALFLGGLALPYALPLPGWARLLIAAGIVWMLNWWLLLLVPLTWPFALVVVPLLTAALNPKR